MPAHTATSMIITGDTATPVTLTADRVPGPPALTIVDGSGRPDREAVDRLHAAICNSGVQATGAHGVVVRLEQPADLPTVRLSSAHDLAIAAVVLASQHDLPTDRLTRAALVGELGLDGRVRPTPGIPAAVRAAREHGLHPVVVPAANLDDAGGAAAVDVLPVDGLAALAGWLRGPAAARRSAPERCSGPNAVLTIPPLSPDLPREVLRAVEIAAVGGHHVLALTPVQAGSLLLARWLYGLLPDLTAEQRRDVDALRGSAGEVGMCASAAPPVQAPHHTSSLVGLLGGGRPVRPGVIARAHAGLLVLDGLPDFGRQWLDALRTVLADGEVRLTQGDQLIRHAAQLQMYAIARPCPCAGSTAPCACTFAEQRRYFANVSGPLLDLIDVRLHLPATTGDTTPASGSPAAEPIHVVRDRVHAARERSAHRWRRFSQYQRTNATVPTSALHEHGLPTALTRSIDRAMRVGALTNRGAQGVLRTAFSAADLDGADSPSRRHVAESLRLRQPQRPSPKTAV